MSVSLARAAAGNVTDAIPCPYGRSSGCRHVTFFPSVSITAPFSKIVARVRRRVGSVPFSKNSPAAVVTNTPPLKLRYECVESCTRFLMVFQAGVLLLLTSRYWMLFVFSVPPPLMLMIAVTAFSAFVAGLTTMYDGVMSITVFVPATVATAVEYSPTGV